MAQVHNSLPLVLRRRTCAAEILGQFVRASIRKHQVGELPTNLACHSLLSLGSAVCFGVLSERFGRTGMPVWSRRHFLSMKLDESIELR